MGINFQDDILDGDFSAPSPKEAGRIDKLLYDGRIISFYTDHLLILPGDEVKIQGQTATDGYYRLSDEHIRFLVKDSKIDQEFYIESYSNNKGLTVDVDGSRIWGIVKGSLVWHDEKPAPDGWYTRTWFSKIYVQDGRVVRKFL